MQLLSRNLPFSLDRDELQLEFLRLFGQPFHLLLTCGHDSTRQRTVVAGRISLCPTMSQSSSLVSRFWHWKQRLGAARAYVELTLSKLM
jgi:hypothetical protein